MKRIIQASLLLSLVLLLMLIGMPTSAAYAADPPWPAGIPWPTTVPWPAPHPLQLGVPWSPSQQTFPISAPTPLPPVAVPQSNSAPLPPVVISSNVSAPLPPVVAPLNVSAPLPPVVPLSNAPVLSGAPNPAPSSTGGSNRFDALQPSDTWRTLDAGGSVWYRIGSGGSHIDVWLDAAPQNGVAMAIYAPNGSDKPVGHGSPDKANPTRLLWSGGNWQSEGDWYALITNGNPVSVQYKIGRTQMDISNKTCWSYWEYIGPDRVYWTKCQ